MPEQRVLTARGTVYPWQCDHMGHTNVMCYVGKFDGATWHLFALLGLTPTFLREHDRGMAAVRQKLSYHRELRAGAVISVYSRVLEVREKVIRLSHDMHNDETHELAAATTITGVYLDTLLRKACVLPDDVRANALQFRQANGDDEHPPDK
ncbi:MAG TPA: thioesterase family protein [Ktedonobacterales bacterium]|nr:thioesterase family protein [Ktedonobacterales bacterium]